jgi:hypothetical protein
MGDECFEAFRITKIDDTSTPETVIPTGCSFSATTVDDAIYHDEYVDSTE